MTKERLDFGKKGEKAAESFLKKKGYRILKKNYRTKVGEIDLIAEHNNVLVFIEVKSRTDAALEHPFMAVTPRKQKKSPRPLAVFWFRIRWVTGKYASMWFPSFLAMKIRILLKSKFCRMPSVFRIFLFNCL